MNSYTELKERHQKEVNAFPLHFAFGGDQINQKIKELKLSKNPKERAKQIVSIGYGSFVLVEDYPKLKEMFERHAKERSEAIEADKTGDGYIFEMFYCELANHEYAYTGDVSDALEALGYTEEKVQADKRLLHGLEKAEKKIIGRS